ncbi:MAG TPA: biotin/lipoate A/B protein ligase family protein [Longimicrobiales bacterium]|nr:biotin/lipoate A/B protein ligase family protein [Longimicrobiales bacterium]
MPGSPAPWRLILDAGTPLCGARNMAVDHALLASVQDGAPPVLRLYTWQPPCLSFGRNQHAAGVYSPDLIRVAGLDVVRRPTGGLAVLHHHELTYAVIAPADPLGGPRAAYGRINAALVVGLRSLGVAAAVAGPARAPNPVVDTAAPCFQAPAPGEVVAGGRKLVGSAQRCERRVLLQHGSILLDGSQEDVAALIMTRPAAAPLVTTAAPGSVTLRELLGRQPPLDELARSLRHGFEEVFGTSLALASLAADEEARARQLEPVYAGPDWTWRR